MRDVSLNPVRLAAADALALDDPALIALSSGNMRVLVAPHVGGSIAAYYEATSGGPVHWLRPATQAALAERDPLGMGSFPLLPYCNRIRDGRFVFEGEAIDLNGDGNRYAHALHGHAWRRAWRVGQRSAHAVELHFEHDPAPDAPGEWPFRYRAEQRIELAGDGLRITLSAHNLAGRPMPFGMGHHPYYPRTPQTRVHAQVQGMWHADREVLPTHLGPHPAVDALRNGMSADAYDLDNNFAGWSRNATIAWPDEGRQLTLTAQAPFDHLVVFAPANQALLCVEPVTNTTDCFNADDTPDHVGGCVLMPDEAMTATVNWTPQRI
ncbi:aldose 1-epimerase [Paraburkholderia sp.]|uniref:aldose 1-epimerase n=1 Tax=Paraburkholderia sp. TaxID=1926495 RepID=UPI002F425EA8